MPKTLSVFIYGGGNHNSKIKLSLVLASLLFTSNPLTTNEIFAQDITLSGGTNGSHASGGGAVIKVKIIQALQALVAKVAMVALVE
ncbi:Uncharacterised protein [Campylobacter lari]|nr:Uncharacterised protein [Campylobacter lari]